MERERRVTAGKRMTFLAGQELENDEAFWTHDTWQEDNESFHSSDAASSAEEDVFDSDFDESENDDDVIANEELIGAAMEREIEQEERDINNKKRSSAYTEVSNKNGNKKKGLGSGGRRPGTGPNGKRVVGDGLNAGIVLNVPPQYQKNYIPRPIVPPPPQQSSLQYGVQLQQQPLATLSTTLPPESTSIHNSDTTGQVDLLVDSTAITPPVFPSSAAFIASPQISQQQPDATVSFQLPPTSAKKKKNLSDPTLAATRVRRSSHENKIARVGARSRKSIKTTDKLSTDKTAPASNGLKRGKQAFTQEELLLEAVQVTEPENERWILGQKRNQAMRDDIETQLRNNQSIDKNTKVIEKFVSRRGYYNTITFPDMDHIPYILQRGHSLSSTPEQQSKQKHLCIITGKLAKFRDPKTGHGYFDIEAFRELRRRYEANELPRSNSNRSADVLLDVTDDMGTTTTIQTDAQLDSTKPKPQRRSKTITNEAGTKRMAATNGRKSNGKKMKETKKLIEIGVIKPISDFEDECLNNSLPLSRPRTTSTGGDSINTFAMPHSMVYDYETISHSNSFTNHANNGNGCNNTITNISSNVPLSPPLSPGRKSPRAPKPTVKVLESARALIPSIMIQQPQLQPQESRNKTLGDDATTLSIIATTQQTSEFVKN